MKRGMIAMLAEELASTVFIPLDRAFKHDLWLQFNNSLQRKSDIHEVASQVLGFSTIPRTLTSDITSTSKKISGCTLYFSKDVDGVLVAYRIPSKRLTRSMDGIIMDADF
ncbi:hypothetical protein MANES_10G016915v8 [Manihot esculenta]|uniref:Uncharacterized protein n=1 Tax=Manihot esculenta TaxID=3983 RepID=A0ACB7GXU2_MANES|nr:hypothetical protein MANES_10G016915v8 [Manihot esculenta]